MPDQDNTTRTALILGMTGGSGRAIADALHRHGWALRALVRTPGRLDAKAPTARVFQGDCMNREDVLRAATEDGPVDVIVHAVNPPGYRDWDKLVLPMIDNSIAAARAAEGARIVLPGTGYNFDPTQTPVITEDSFQNATTRKGRIRVELEERLRTAAPEVPSLILRAGDFFGPTAGSNWFSDAMIRPGKPPRIFIDPGAGTPHAYAYLPDLAEAFARLLEEAPRLRPFERLQFEGHWDHDGRQMQDAVERVTGRRLLRVGFPWWLMRALAPFGGFPGELKEIRPIWRHPMRLDGRRLHSVIGPEPHHSLDDAIQATLQALGCISNLDRNAATSGRLSMQQRQDAETR